MLRNGYLGQGQGPAPIGPGTTGALSAYPVEMYQSPLLDLTQTVSGIELIPARPGYIPIIELALWETEFTAGTQTSPPTVRAGNDAGHTNFINTSSTTPSNANVNAANVPCLITGPTGALSNQTAQQIPNATVLLDVTAGAAGTGGFALRAKLVCMIFWVAVGS